MPTTQCDRLFDRCRMGQAKMRTMRRIGDEATTNKTACAEVLLTAPRGMGADGSMIASAAQSGRVLGEANRSARHCIRRTRQGGRAGGVAAFATVHIIPHAHDRTVG